MGAGAGTSTDEYGFARSKTVNMDGTDTDQPLLKLESLTKGKTLEVKPEPTGLPDPPVERWSKLKGVIKSLRSGFSNLAGGLKEVTGCLVSSGGGALILIEGFKSLVKIGQHSYNQSQGEENHRRTDEGIRRSRDQAG